jgi:hypothetical protein
MLSRQEVADRIERTGMEVWVRGDRLRVNSVGSVDELEVAVEVLWDSRINIVEVDGDGGVYDVELLNEG